jgi:hypothetical protein
MAKEKPGNLVTLTPPPAWRVWILAAHRSAHQRSERAVDATDDTVAKREGRAITSRPFVCEL